ncbi:MAG: AmmeMemoRadiSam system radical SAM enzyme [Planctomycetes bacterium]|nr:AmmeMemoRadiSam system radical SAM enzyme [Planctomycetota bacterium]
MDRRRFLTVAGNAFAALSPAAALLLAAGGSRWVGRSRSFRTQAHVSPSANPFVQEAQFWQSACAGVQCTLCPFECFLPEGARGLCKVRMNSGGRLVTLVYGHPVAVHVDPMEKKPVFHLLPGSLIYSLATVGCNLKCTFCQNWEISQTYPEQAESTSVVPVALKIFRTLGGRSEAQIEREVMAVLSPAQVVEAALNTRCRSVAYTYSEPTVFYEYVVETARLARQKGLRNVLVSCGYVNPQPLRQMARFFDVVKIDLKGFDETFYRRVVGGELKFVLRTLIELKRLGVLTEIVNLVVPSLNDDPRTMTTMCRWILDNLGPDVPLFFSRFAANYQLQNLPSTPIETLDRARQIALETGLHYVYLGNVPGHAGENTYCPACSRVLVRRHGYAVMENLLTLGKCPYDDTPIPGIWY